MIITKKTIKQLKALSLESRMKVLLRLRQGTANVSALLRVTKCEPTLMSHHLNVLRSAGLVEGERRGKQVYYSLTEGTATDDGLDLGKIELSFK